MIIYIISECSKLAPKLYKIGEELAGKMIQWDSCMKIKFIHATKWYMFKSESVREIESKKRYVGF